MAPSDSKDTVDPSIYLSVYLSVYISIYLSIFLSTYLSESIYLSRVSDALHATPQCEKPETLRT